MSHRIVVNVVKELSRLLTKVFWRNYGFDVARIFPLIIAFIAAVTFAPQVMSYVHQEWMRLVLGMWLVLLFILSIAMAIFFLYQIGTDEDLQ